MLKADWLKIAKSRGKMGEHNKNCKDVSRPTVGTRFLLLKLVQLADLVKGGHLLVELVHAWWSGCWWCYFVHFWRIFVSHQAWGDFHSCSVGGLFLKYFYAWNSNDSLLSGRCVFLYAPVFCPRVHCKQIFLKNSPMYCTSDSVNGKSKYVLKCQRFCLEKWTIL